MSINKILIILTSWIFGVQSCKTSLKNQSVGVNSKVLLQETKGRLAYIFLLKDTAYYEFRQIDKPSYFISFDTLVLNKSCFCYQGRQTTLFIDKASTRLRFLKDENAGKELNFIYATPKQEKKWNSYKNLDKYNSLNERVDSLLIVNTTNRILYTTIKQDWQSLLLLTSTMDQNNFDSVIHSFQSKYLMIEK